MTKRNICGVRHTGQGLGGCVDRIEEAELDKKRDEKIGKRERERESADGPSKSLI